MNRHRFPTDKFLSPNFAARDKLPQFFSSFAKQINRFFKATLRVEFPPQINPNIETNNFVSPNPLIGVITKADNKKFIHFILGHIFFKKYEREKTFPYCKKPLIFSQWLISKEKLDFICNFFENYSMQRITLHCEIHFHIVYTILFNKKT